MIQSLIDFIKANLQYQSFGIAQVGGSFIVILFGVTVLLKDRRDPKNQVYFFLCLTVNQWLFNWGMMSLVENPALIRFWLSMSYLIGIPYIAPALYHFSCVVRGDNKKKKRTIILAYFSGIVLSLPMVLFNKYLVEMHGGWGVYSRLNESLPATIYKFLYFIQFTTLPFLALRNYFLGWKRAINQRERGLYGFLLIAFLIGSTGYTDILAAEGLVNVYPFGFVSVSIMFALTAYAIMRYQFLAVRTRLNQIVFWLLLSTIVATPFLFLFHLARPWFSDLSDFQIFFLGLPLFYLGLLYYRAVQSRIDAFFSHQSQKNYQLASSFIKEIRWMESLDTLYQKIQFISDRVFAASETGLWWRINDTFFQLAPYKKYADIPIDRLAALGVDINQVPEQFSLLKLNIPWQNYLLEVASYTHSSFAIPLFVKGSVQGFWTLDQQGKAPSFYDNELEMLETLGAEIAIAIENARMYEHYQNELKLQTTRIKSQVLEMQGTKKQLESLIQFKDDITSNITHELKSPLHILEKYVRWLLKGSYGKVPARQKEKLLIVQNNTARLSKMIEDLLLTSKLEANQLELENMEFDLIPLIQDVIRFFQPLSREKGLPLKLDLPHGPLFISGDPEKWTMVLNNLVSNALKFTQHGYIEVKATVRDKKVVVSVADTGTGIPEKDRANIFKKFFRSEHTAKLAKGTGLGLSIVKGIVEAHHGSIEVLSHNAQGSRFVVTIPKLEKAQSQ